jgi:hypothetical protein
MTTKTLEILLNVLCYVLLACIIWRGFWLAKHRPRKAEEMKQTLESFRTSVTTLSRERDEYRARAEWTQMYAAQLESELDIPPENRIDSESWRKAKR